MPVSHRLAVTAVAATLAFVSAPAFAGEGCRNCYRQVVEPPVYETALQPVLLRGPRTAGYVIPEEYTTISEKVEIEPARRIWQVSHDSWGRKVGCWVTIPGRYAWRERRVVSRPAEMVPVAVTQVYGLRRTQVMVVPTRLGWEPTQALSDFRVESVVSRAY